MPVEHGERISDQARRDCRRQDEPAGDQAVDAESIGAEGTSRRDRQHQACERLRKLCSHRARRTSAARDLASGHHVPAALSRAWTRLTRG